MTRCENGLTLEAGAVFKSPLPHDPEACMVATYVPRRDRGDIFTARRIFYGPDREVYLALRPEHFSLPSNPLSIVDYWSPYRIREIARRTREMAFLGFGDDKLRKAAIDDERRRLDLEMAGPPDKLSKTNPKLQVDPENPIISRATRARWLRG